jgi:hypothetical protein
VRTSVEMRLKSMSLGGVEIPGDEAGDEVHFFLA